MNADQFVAAWRNEKELLLTTFTDAASGAAAAQILTSLGLTKEQEAGVVGFLDEVLNDTFYNLLLGLDGATSIGGVQEQFRILTNAGESVSSPGELEAAAWTRFHGEGPRI